MCSNSNVAKVAKVCKSAKFIAVQKWELELNCKLEYDIINGKVEKLVCSTCKITPGNSIFSTSWVRPGSTNVEKESLVKHLKGKQHKRAADL